MCNELGAVRRERGNDRLYYVCPCGGPYPADAFIAEHGELWGTGGPPDGIPQWIAKGLRFKPGTRETGDRPRGPARPRPVELVDDSRGDPPLFEVEPGPADALLEVRAVTSTPGTVVPAGAVDELEPPADVDELEQPDEPKRDRWGFGLFR